MARGGRPEVELVDVATLDREAWDALDRTVIRPSFPPAELMTTEEMRSYTSENCVLPGMAAVRDGEPVGVILGDFFDGSRVALLSYLAARPDQRGSGIGRTLLDTASARWWDEAKPEALVLEVEDPRYHIDSGFGDPVRRLRFYAGAGARMIAMAYTQPSLRPGLPRVPGMVLLELGGQRETIPSAILTEFLSDYYESCEGPAALGDPEYRAMIAQVTGAPGGAVRLLPPSEWPHFRTTPQQEGAQ